MKYVINLNEQQMKLRPHEPVNFCLLVPMNIDPKELK